MLTIRRTVTMRLRLQELAVVGKADKLKGFEMIKAVTLDGK